MELDDKSIIGCTHGVGLDLHHDLFGAISKLKGTDGLADTIGLGVTGSDEASFGVTPKRVLQKSCEL